LPATCEQRDHSLRRQDPSSSGTIVRNRQAASQSEFVRLLFSYEALFGGCVSNTPQSDQRQIDRGRGRAARFELIAKPTKARAIQSMPVDRLVWTRQERCGLAQPREHEPSSVGCDLGQVRSNGLCRW